MAITKQDVVNTVNSLIKARCNSGISWGNNSYPQYSLPGWFGGSTAGVTAGATPPGNAVATAADVVNVITSYAAAFAGIRNVQITLYKSMNGYNPSEWNTDYWGAWTQTLFNGSGVAFTAYPAAAPSASGYTLVKGATIKLSDVNDICNRLYNSYVANSRGGSLLLTNTICHYNCHSNCHNSRHRR